MEGEGSGGDFFIDTLDARITPKTGDSLQVTFRVDGVALEPDETFQLRLTTDAPVPPDENYFFVDTLNVIIQDPEGKFVYLAVLKLYQLISCLLSTGIEIEFSESDYSTSEGDEEIVVRVQTSGRRATPVTVRVTPMIYDDFLKLGKPLPADFPDVPLSNDGPDVLLDDIKSPNRATGELQSQR